MSLNLIKFTIPNWTKFNPRSDRANFSWFRMQNGLFSDQGVFGLNDAQKVLYLFLVCEASKKNSGTGEVLVSYVSAMLGHKPQDIIKNFNAILDVGLMAAESRHDDGKSPGIIPATYVRTDETNETNETERDETKAAGIQVGKEISKPKSGAASEEEGKQVSEFIGLYCELWKSRYKTNPEMGGKPAGVAKRLVKNLGIRRARELVYAYLEMNDIWFIQQRHDLTTLEAKLSAVVIYADTGATVTQGELRQADKTQTNRNVWDSLKAPVGGANGK